MEAAADAAPRAVATEARVDSVQGASHEAAAAAAGDGAARETCEGAGGDETVAGAGHEIFGPTWAKGGRRAKDRVSACVRACVYCNGQADGIEAVDDWAAHRLSVVAHDHTIAAAAAAISYMLFAMNSS